jgi:hypothetical protein
VRKALYKGEALDLLAARPAVKPDRSVKEVKCGKRDGCADNHDGCEPWQHPFVEGPIRAPLRLLQDRFFRIRNRDAAPSFAVLLQKLLLGDGFGGWIWRTGSGGLGCWRRSSLGCCRGAGQRARQDRSSEQCAHGSNSHGRLLSLLPSHRRPLRPSRWLRSLRSPGKPSAIPRRRSRNPSEQHAPCRSAR